MCVKKKYKKSHSVSSKGRERDINWCYMDSLSDHTNNVAVHDHMEKIVHECLHSDTCITIVRMVRTAAGMRYHQHAFIEERQLVVYLCVFHGLEICFTIGEFRMKSHAETRRLLIHNICVQLGNVMSSDYYSFKFSIGMVPQLITNLNLTGDDIICLLSAADDRYDLSGREYMILTMDKNNVNDSQPGYRKVSQMAIDIISSIYAKHMCLFRAMDTVGNLFLSCKKEYKSLLLCEMGTIEPLCHSMRIGYYLSYVEPHFRNLLFGFFRVEIWLCLFLFYNSLDIDVGRRLTMDYINLLLSR